MRTSHPLPSRNLAIEVARIVFRSICTAYTLPISLMSTPESSVPCDSGEETPLLQHSASYSHDTEATVTETKKYTPLPKLQIAICLLIQFAEPVTAQCILPFINQLVSELDITNGDEGKVGYYVGIIVRLCCGPFRLQLFLHG